MRTTAERIISIIEWINEGIGKCLSWVCGILVLLICYDVLTRYLFNYTRIWISELEWHLFALIFLIGAGYTYLHEKHVRVDVFYSRYSEIQKAWTNLIGCVVFLIPFCIIAIQTGGHFVERSFFFQEGSADPGGLPARYIIKSSISIGFALLLIQGISHSIKAILVLTNSSSSEEVQVNPANPS